MAASTINIQIHEDYENQVDEAKLRRAAELTLERAGDGAPVSLTIVIADADTVRELNAQYLGKDAPTDVLSFPAEEDPATREPDAPPYLGDILIAWPIAEKQAMEAGHSPQFEAHFLAVHGTLHLLGYDHATPDDQAEMWAMQSIALDALREALR